MSVCYRLRWIKMNIYLAVAYKHMQQSVPYLYTPCCIRLITNLLQLSPSVWSQRCCCSCCSVGRLLVFDDQTTSPVLLPIVYPALHRTVPRYLSDLLRRVADVPPRPVVDLLWTGRSSVATCNRRWSALAGGGSRTWNTLLDAITSAPSVTTAVFRRRLNTHVFRQYYLHINVKLVDTSLRRDGPRSLLLATR